MTTEQRSTLIVVCGPNNKLPQSRKFEVVGHRVNFENSFSTEVARLRSSMENFLVRGNKISLAGIGPCGLVTTAAFVENDTWHPSTDDKNATEIVTFGTRFQQNNFDLLSGGRFEEDGIAWLRSKATRLVSLKEKITTVVWQDNIFMTEAAGTLDGVNKEIIFKESSTGDILGPSVIVEGPLDIYFRKTA